MSSVYNASIPDASAKSFFSMGNMDCYLGRSWNSADANATMDIAGFELYGL